MKFSFAASCCYSACSPLSHFLPNCCCCCRQPCCCCRCCCCCCRVCCVWLFGGLVCLSFCLLCFLFVCLSVCLLSCCYSQLNPVCFRRRHHHVLLSFVFVFVSVGSCCFFSSSFKVHLVSVVPSHFVSVVLFSVVFVSFGVMLRPPPRVLL